MIIKRTISGSKRNTSTTYKQEINRSKKVLENVLKEKNKQQMEYVLSVAELKAKGEDLSIVKLKKLFNKAIVKEEVAQNKERMRLINFYLNSLGRKEAQKFIEKFEDSGRR